LRAVRPSDYALLEAFTDTVLVVVDPSAKVAVTVTE
jgi:hypothetical protein